GALLVCGKLKAAGHLLSISRRFSNPVHLWAGLAFLTLLVGRPAMAAEPCPTVARVELAVEALNEPVRYVYDKSTNQLTAMPGRGHGPQGTLKSAVLGLSS
ncbi:hypothetical protein JZU69_01555, partial [bacterium]|nr:hypothetical protein [bacterium]